MSGSSTTDWMEKMEENMSRDREENQALLKSMMDQLERMELMNNERLEAGTSRGIGEIVEGKRVADMSKDDEPGKRGPYGIKSILVGKDS